MFKIFTECNQMHNMTHFFTILFQNTVFAYLRNSSALYYYGSINSEYNDTLRFINFSYCYP